MNFINLCDTYLAKITMATPHKGYNCIIHIYKTFVNDEKIVSV